MILGAGLNRHITAERDIYDRSMNSVPRFIRGFMEKEGFTLIEVIIFIVIAGIILPTIVVPFATSVKQSLTPQKIATATYLANQRVEQFTKNAYDLIQTEVQPYAAITGFPNYQWSWNVKWVDSDLKNSATDVGYKHISVMVKDSDNHEIELQTLVTRRPVDE
jgi:type II secretory pathway pseudopilin PulG